MLDLCSSLLMNGLIGALLACGMFISLKILRFFDLTACGSFVLGSSVCIYLANSGRPMLAIFIPLLCGAVLGCITASIHIKFNIPKVLSGIISSAIVFTIVSLLNLKEIEQIQVYTGYKALMFMLCVASIALFYKFIVSEFGLQIRAIGGSTAFSNTFTINRQMLSLIGLSISNIFIALAGAIAGIISVNSISFNGISVFLFGTVLILSTERRITRAIKYNVYYEFIYAILIGTVYYIVIYMLHNALNLSISIESISSIFSIVLIIIHFAEKRFVGQNNNDYFWGMKSIYYK